MKNINLQRSDKEVIMHSVEIRSMWMASMSNMYKTSVTGSQIVHSGVQPKE